MNSNPVQSNCHGKPTKRWKEGESPISLPTRIEDTGTTLLKAWSRENFKKITYEVFPDNRLDLPDD